ncbi:MAG: PAS domain S-box protein [Endomicrobiales bacterium]|nr:PAS domain S-box protein [Endomicrobiales bacterium]
MKNKINPESHNPNNDIPNSLYDAKDISNLECMPILTAMEDGFIIWDMNNKIHYINPSFERLTGYSLNDLINKNINDFIPHWFRNHEFEKALRYFQFVMKKDIMVPERFTITRKDDYSFPVRLFAYTITDKNTNTPYLAGIIKDITEVNLLEITLSESERKFKNIVEASSDIIFTTDTLGTVTYISDLIDRVSGFNFEDCAGKMFMSLLPASEINNFIKTYSEAVKNHSRIENYKLKIKRKDGTVFDALINMVPIRKNDKVTGMQGTMRDITEQESIKEKERQLIDDLSFLSMTAMGFVEFTPGRDIYYFIGEQLKKLVDNSYIIVNSFSESSNTYFVKAILGMERHLHVIQNIFGGEVIGKPVDFNSETARRHLLTRKLIQIKEGLQGLSFQHMPESVYKTMDKILDTDEIYAIGFTNREKMFANAIILLKKGAKLKNKDVIETFARQASIVLQRRFVEDALRLSEERYRMLFNSSSDAILVYNLKASNTPSTFININDITCKMTGYAREELMNMSPSDIINSGDMEKDLKNLSDFNNKDHIIFESTIIAKNKARIPVEISSHHFILDDTPIVISIVRDITERKKSEKEKGQMLSHLIQSKKMEAISVLAGGLAHDLNNLFSGIIGLTDLLIEEMNKDNPHITDIEEIRANVIHGTNLINQLLLFGKKNIMEFKRTNPNICVKEMMKALKKYMGSDITIETILSEDIWDINADKASISQVVMNLLLNARDAMPNGGKITIQTENKIVDKITTGTKMENEIKPGKYIYLSLADTGIGMEENVCERIFEPFFTTRGMEKSSGLGLFVVYGIIKNHEGYIKVNSKPGSGTAFQIYIPAFLEKSDEKKGDTFTSNIPGKENKRVLLVEDEDIVRKVAKRILQKNGYTVFEATNVREALNVFEMEGGNFNLLFSDVVLPDKDGFYLANKITSERPDIKVLLSSGYANDKIQDNVIKEKGFEYLSKPYTQDELILKLDKLLNN